MQLLDAAHVSAVLATSVLASGAHACSLKRCLNFAKSQCCSLLAVFASVLIIICVPHSSLRRIVGLTADTTSRVVQACRDAGMSDVLFKPTTASAIMLFLSSVVRSSEPSQSCSEQAPAHTGSAVPLPKTEVSTLVKATLL
jgi:hypothetical protein